MLTEGPHDHVFLFFSLSVCPLLSCVCVCVCAVYLQQSMFLTRHDKPPQERLTGCSLCAARPYLTRCWPKRRVSCTDCVQLLSASVIMTLRANDLPV